MDQTIAEGKEQDIMIDVNLKDHFNFNLHSLFSQTPELSQSVIRKFQ